MSLIKTSAVQVGQSGTASNNFHWRNLLDGLLRLSRGNAGSPITDVMCVRADNSVEFPSGVASGVLGAGQTWQNVTGSRAAGVTYTNSTGRPIFVVPSIHHGGGGAFYTATFTIDGVQVAYMNSGNPAYSTGIPYGFVIPVGATYQLAITGGTGAMNYWSELR